MIRILCLLPIIVLSFGCGGVKLRKDSVEVSGKAMFADGTPISSGLISFQPLEDTNPGGAKLSNEGTFTVNLTPGKYAVYFPASDNLTLEEQANYAKIPAAYRQASKNFTFDVKAGTPLEIRLK